MDIVEMLGFSEMKNEIEIDSNSNFRDIMNNILKIKEDYNRILSSFLLEDIKKRNMFLRETKRKIYDLKFAVWKKDKIWNYLNGNEYYDTLLGILDREKKK